MNLVLVEAEKNTRTAVDDKKIITGFHAIEERVLVLQKDPSKAPNMHIYYSKPGPRIKKILASAQKYCVLSSQVYESTLNSMVSELSEALQDHRGIVLEVKGEKKAANLVDFDAWLAENRSAETKTVLILDSVTDPHNVGAILRSADQFACNLVVIPENRAVSNIDGNDIILRTSAGASSWVPVAVVTNLVRTAQALKEAGFWIYGADAGGENVTNLSFADKTCLIMGSEGSGIARLLEEQCDTIVSIPTAGKIDSLNVSVAAGVLLYEIKRKNLSK